MHLFVPNKFRYQMSVALFVGANISSYLVIWQKDEAKLF